MRGSLLAAALNCGLILSCQPRVEVISDPGASPAGSRYAAVISETPGLVAYFRMTDAASGTLLDRVGGTELRASSQRFAVEGAIPEDPEPYGLDSPASMASGFTGPASDALTSSSEMSVELWLAPGLPPSGTTCAVPALSTRLAWVDGSKPPLRAAWNLALHPSDHSAVDFSVVIDPDGSGLELDALTALSESGVLAVPAPPSCVGERWQHVVATAATTGALAGLRIYVDGVLTPHNGDDHPNVNVPDVSAQGGLGSFSPDAQLHLAEAIADMNQTDPDATSPYIGGMDELAIYSRALSPAQVAEHYTAGIEGGRTGAITIPVR